MWRARRVTCAIVTSLARDGHSTCCAARSLVHPCQLKSIFRCTRGTSIYISQRQSARGLGLLSNDTKCSKSLLYLDLLGGHSEACVGLNSWVVSTRCLANDMGVVHKKWNQCFLTTVQFVHLAYISCAVSQSYLWERPPCNWLFFFTLKRCT
jgi:hypothetical protein